MPSVRTIKKQICLLTAALIAAALCGCSASSPYVSRTYAMGADVVISVYGGGQADAAAAESAVKKLDGELSWRGDGEIASLNAAGSAVLSEDVLAILSVSQSVSAATGGVYDMTVLPLVRLWGFDGASPSKPSDGDIAAALAAVDYTKAVTENGITSLNGTQIDLSAAGKGAACETAVNALRKNGVASAVVSVGGSVGLLGGKSGKPFSVAVRDPFGSGGYLGTLSLSDSYISTSGSYEKYFVEDGVLRHHILDANTGYPAESGLVSVTVVCGGGALSDILSTAAFAVGYEKGEALLARYGAEGVFVFADGTVAVTEGLKDKWTAEK